MTQQHRGQLIRGLRNKRVRDLFVAEHISEGVAFQIRAMREKRGWTQGELGERAGGMKQEQISVLENPNYGRPSLSTLKRIASAFDVVLAVRFVPFSEFIDWTLSLTPEQMKVQGFEEDSGLQPTPATPTAPVFVLHADSDDLPGRTPSEFLGLTGMDESNADGEPFNLAAYRAWRASNSSHDAELLTVSESRGTASGPMS